MKLLASGFMGQRTDCLDDHIIILHHRLNIVQPQNRYLAVNAQLTQITSLGYSLLII